MRRIAITAIALAALAVTAAAQGTSVPFGGLQQDTDLPVEIAADRLEVTQETGQAVFIGTVVASQGAMRLAADRLEVTYANAEEGAAPDGIQSLRASGRVTLSNGAEAAEAAEAVYTIASGVIVLSGDVLLTQGETLIAGDRLTVTLATGAAVMEGRVTTILQPR
jgi:lipopolysaccharide export system protein LptA